MPHTPVPRSVFPNLRSLRRHSTLRCPDCRVWMQPFACRNAIVDKCPECNGIWFDGNELGIFRDTLSTYDLSHLKILKPEPEDIRMAISQCGRCNEFLELFTYSTNTKVRLQRCPKCEGIWSPFHQTLNLIELTRFTQLIGPDVRGVGIELRKHREEVEHWQNVKAVGDQLSIRLGWWGRLWYGNLFGIIPRAVPIMAPIGTDRSGPLDLGIEVLAIILVNLALLGFGGTSLMFAMGMRPTDLWAGRDLPTLFSSMFAHAGFMHFFWNMLYLWIFGRDVSRQAGAFRFLLGYLAAGVSASLIHAIANPGSASVALGSSGAVSGVLGAYFSLFPSARVHTLMFWSIFSVPAWLYLGGWLGFQALSALFGSPGIAWYAHVGGFAAGWLLARLFCERPRPVESIS